jgi:hypothetical protein
MTSTIPARPTMVLWHLPPLFLSWLSYRFPPALRIQSLCASIIPGIHQNLQCTQAKTHNPTTPPSRRPIPYTASRIKSLNWSGHVKSQSKSRQRDHQIWAVSFVSQAFETRALPATHSRVVWAVWAGGKTNPQEHTVPPHVCGPGPTIPTWHSNLLPTERARRGVHASLSLWPFPNAHIPLCFFC